MAHQRLVDVFFPNVRLRGLGHFQKIRLIGIDFVLGPFFSAKEFRVTIDLYVDVDLKNETIFRVIMVPCIYGRAGLL